MSSRVCLLAVPIGSVNKDVGVPGGHGCKKKANYNEPTLQMAKPPIDPSLRSATQLLSSSPGSN